MANKRNIVLIGMPGAGKSTVGVVLAKILNYDFADVDLIIQQKHGSTLQSLIDTLGPRGFIDIENEALKGIDLQDTVISTGGSAVYSEEGMRHLAEDSIVVYLKASLDEISSRLVDFDERGIVMLQDGIMSLADLYGERAPLYERHADIAVEIDGLGITESARLIAGLLADQ